MTPTGKNEIKFHLKGYFGQTSNPLSILEPMWLELDKTPWNADPGTDLAPVIHFLKIGYWIPQRLQS